MTEDEYLLVRNLQLLKDAHVLLCDCVPPLTVVIKKLDLEISELEKKVSNTLESD